MKYLNLLFSDYIRGFVLWHDFSGIATRRQFWMFMLVSWIIDAALRFTDNHFDLFLNISKDGSLSAPIQVGMLTFLYLTVAIVPMVAVVVRRLHDINLSGWWALLWLIPVVGFFCVVAFGLVKSIQTSRWRKSGLAAGAPPVTKCAFAARASVSVPVQPKGTGELDASKSSDHLAS